jgi:hypothetical protein
MAALYCVLFAYVGRYYFSIILGLDSKLSINFTKGLNDAHCDSLPDFRRGMAVMKIGTLETTESQHNVYLEFLKFCP